MANDLLIAAIRRASLDVEEVADVAGVDIRTAQRWLGGRIPHPRYRLKLAEALGLHEEDLWPETGRKRGKRTLEEIVAAFSRRNDPEAPDWRALLRTAEQQIDLLGYSLAHIAEARQINKLLTSKATDGCRVRIATANPQSQAVLAADQQQRPPGRLIGRVQNSHRQLLAVIGHPGLELRQHQVATTHTILRFDQQMLVTIHLYGTPGFQAPFLHLRHQHDYGLFDQFAKHFEDVWQTAQPVGASPAAVPSPSQRRSTEERDRLLDSLDDVWRPGN